METIQLKAVSEERDLGIIVSANLNRKNQYIAAVKS